MRGRTGASTPPACSRNAPSTGRTGFVRLGSGADDAGVSCAADRLQGPLRLSGNKGGVEVEGATTPRPGDVSFWDALAAAAPLAEPITVSGVVRLSIPTRTRTML